MEDKLQELNAKWFYGILISLCVFVLINVACYAGATWYTNVVDYEIVYDSVVVRVETSVNGLETMAFGPEDIRFTKDEPRIERRRCLIADDSLLYLPKEEYDTYREMLFSDQRLSMDKEKYIQRNKESALARFGDQLDDTRNVVGTDFYFDHFWRLRKREETKK